MKKPAAGKVARRCAALDSQGNRCRSTQTRVDSYHGDGEIYDYITELSDEKTPAWVFVCLCKLHHCNWEKMKGMQSVI